MKRFIAWIKARRPWAAVFWLALWQLAAMVMNQRLLIVSPLETLQRWLELAATAAFWRAALFSLSRILAGFSLATLLGVLLAALSARYPRIEPLLAPLLSAVRAIPVASFVIIALIWLPSRRLSVLISFLIAFPIVYGGMLSGLRQTDPKLREMAMVFRLSPLRRAVYIAFPAVLPNLRAALETAMGLAWKSGVAAEVIAIPSGSIGEGLYRAKLYLATPDLFAWTLTIVLLSHFCERGILRLIDLAARLSERM